MKTLAVAAALLAAVAAPAFAQDWSIGAGTGPFVFGHFFERTVRAGTEVGAGNSSKVITTARPRPGLSVDIERNVVPRVAVRFQAAFTESPISIKGGGGPAVSLDAGKIDVTSTTLPVVFRINTRGAVRFYLVGGPAYALYHMRRRPAGQTQALIFEGTRGRWGFVGGGGLEWWWSDRFAAEGQIADIDTASPFKRSDFGPSALITIPRTHNVHTTAGLRWRF